jgi:hypothetical protein
LKDISQVTCLVHDCGLFLPFARRMAEECKRVIWYNHDRRAFPSIKQGTVGDGFDNIEVVHDFWPILEDIDLACFPDIHNSGTQLHLQHQGIAVWGSRTGDILEIDREEFMATIGRAGLEVPKHKVVVGLKGLTEYLKPREDQYIKVSRWRGDLETTHWRNWKMDSGWLDWLAVNLGPLKEHMRFLVFDKIETSLEIGGDTYSVDGAFPDLMLNGIESKDTTYFAAVTKRGEMPGPIQEILQALEPFLYRHQYRNQISFEDRVTEDAHFYIDATQRGGMPSSGSQQLLWENFPEIVWAGANGEVLEPEPTGKFSIECMVTSKGGKDTWDTVEIPKELERWFRASNCCFVDGAYAFAPDEHHSGELGWLVAIGDTPRETLDMAKHLADLLPDGLDANLENLTGLIKEIEEAEEKDIHFTRKPMPTPAEVIED